MQACEYRLYSDIQYHTTSERGYSGTKFTSLY